MNPNLLHLLKLYWLLRTRTGKKPYLSQFTIFFKSALRDCLITAWQGISYLWFLVRSISHHLSHETWLWNELKVPPNPVCFMFPAGAEVISDLNSNVRIYFRSYEQFFEIFGREVLCITCYKVFERATYKLLCAGNFMGLY